MKRKIRKFETGATRDSDNDKLDYEGFNDPYVEKKYAEYMHKNRFLPDGSVRDSDNWQKGFGDKHLDVCIKSLHRHFMDLRLEHRGYPSREGLDDALCAIIFNAKAYYYWILRQRRNNVMQDKGKKRK